MARITKKKVTVKTRSRTVKKVNKNVSSRRVRKRK